MVIVGGWVPELLIENAPRAHIGRLDVDVALNHRTLHKVGYKTILQARGTWLISMRQRFGWF